MYINLRKNVYIVVFKH